MFFFIALIAVASAVEYCVKQHGDYMANVKEIGVCGKPENNGDKKSYILSKHNNTHLNATYYTDADCKVNPTHEFMEFSGTIMTKLPDYIITFREDNSQNCENYKKDIEYNIQLKGCEPHSNDDKCESEKYFAEGNKVIMKGYKDNACKTEVRTLETFECDKCMQEGMGFKKVVCGFTPAKPNTNNGSSSIFIAIALIFAFLF